MSTDDDAPVPTDADTVKPARSRAQSWKPVLIVFAVAIVVAFVQAKLRGRPLIRRSPPF